MQIGIQCNSMGQRCGIFTYTQRLQKYLSKEPDVKSKIFANKYKNGKMDVLSVQYEPGLMPPQQLYSLIQQYTEPIIVTAHHMGNLQQFYPMLDGIVIHDESQLGSIDKPWNYKVIPHPALVYPKKDKTELRKKYGLPLDKKIIGTMGFICGTGKILPLTVHNILSKMKDDEFLYLITPFWKGGDMGRYNDIMNVVQRSGKTNNFKIETDFMADDEILNEKMQCCDLMYCWNQMDKNSPGSQSGSAADVYGARVKMIVKDNPHFSFIGKQDKVLLGRESAEDFAQDVIEALRTSDLNDVQNPEHLSWEVQIKSYIEYFKELII
jgi:hypothetical protein